jgi:L-rhamnose mutarotase
MKIALHSVLREGQESNYGEVHASVPLDLTASLATAGIRDWTIWRSGRHLFHLVECDDFEGAMSQLDLDPVNDRWQEYMAQFVDHFETVSEGFKGMIVPTVWNFRAQLDTQRVVDHAKTESS